MGSDKNAKHKASMEKQKANVDHGIGLGNLLFYRELKWESVYLY